MSFISDPLIHQPANRAVPTPVEGKYPTISARNPAHFALVLVAVIFLSPIPTGGNYPIVWMFWAAFFSVALAFSIRTNPATFVDLWTRNQPLLAIGVLLAIVAVLQALLPRGSLTTIALGTGQFQIPTGSLSPPHSIAASFRIASSTMFFALCLWAFSNPGRNRRVAKLILTGIALHGAIALAAQPLIGELLTGPFANHNAFATYLGLGLVLGISLLLYPPGPRNPQGRSGAMLIAACVAVILFALLATQSRMGIAATVVALFIPFACKKGGLVWFLLLVVAVTTVAAFASGLLERLLWIPEAGQTRLALYAQVVDLISARPFAGYGADAFPMAFDLVHRPPVTSEFVWNRAHSTYLGLWVEYGIILGSLPLLGGIIIAIHLIRTIKTPGRNRALPLAALAALCLGAVHSTIDFSLEIQANAFLLLGIIALGLAPLDERHPPTENSKLTTRYPQTTQRRT